MYVAGDGRIASRHLVSVDFGGASHYSHFRIQGCSAKDKTNVTGTFRGRGMSNKDNDLLVRVIAENNVLMYATCITNQKDNTRLGRDLPIVLIRLAQVSDALY
jgi:hypothetical protein